MTGLILEVRVRAAAPCAELALVDKERHGGGGADEQGQREEGLHRHVEAPRQPQVQALWASLDDFKPELRWHVRWLQYQS